jgi:hypothetical protein
MLDQDLGSAASPALTAWRSRRPLGSPPAGRAEAPDWVRFVLVPGLTDDAAQIGDCPFRRGLGVVDRSSPALPQMGASSGRSSASLALDESSPSTELVERTGDLRGLA